MHTYSVVCISRGGRWSLTSLEGYTYINHHCSICCVQGTLTSTTTARGVHLDLVRSFLLRTLRTMLIAQQRVVKALLLRTLRTMRTCCKARAAQMSVTLEDRLICCARGALRSTTTAINIARSILPHILRILWYIVYCLQQTALTAGTRRAPHAVDVDIHVALDRLAFGIVHWYC